MPIPGVDYVGLACGALIFNKSGQIFMMLRGKNTRADHGKWGIPGGLVEMNETVEQAIKRECMEECGVELVSIKPMGYVDHMLVNEQKHFVSQLFIVEQYNGTPDNMEPEKFDEVAWFYPDKLPVSASEVVKSAVEQYTKARNVL